MNQNIETAYNHLFSLENENTKYEIDIIYIEIIKEFYVNNIKTTKQNDIDIIDFDDIYNSYNKNNLIKFKKDIMLTKAQYNILQSKKYN